MTSNSKRRSSSNLHGLLSVLAAMIAVTPSLGCSSTAGPREVDPTASADAGCSTSDDPLNCGACGRDCLGGACAHGQCQPAHAGGVPEGGTVSSMIAHGSSVYLAIASSQSAPRSPSEAPLPYDEIATASVDADGGTPAPVYVGLLGPHALAADDSGRLFWGSWDGNLMSGMADGGALPTVVVAGQTGIDSIVVTQGTVFWRTTSPSAIVSLAYAAGQQATPVIVAAPSQVGGPLVVADGAVLYVDGAAIMRVIVTGGTPSVAAVTTGKIAALSGDSERIYWTDDAGLHAMRADGSEQGVLPVGKPVDLVASHGNAFGWSSSQWSYDDALWAIAGDGGAEVIAQENCGGGCTTAASASAVYWVSSDGGLTRLAR